MFAARTEGATPEAPTVQPTRSPLWDHVSERTLALVVVGACVLLYLPFCGSYGFWDPWEGHYAEVARQMRVRGDWISLFWPGSPLDRAEFWSKPVLTFWVEALMFKLFGIGGPGAPAGQMALSALPEWACRIPMVLFGALGVWGVHFATSRLLSRRAGVLAALVCATSPMYFFIARQAMTDMPFVGPMTAALCLGAVALLDGDAELPRRRVGRFDLPDSPWFYGFAAIWVLVTVPQLVYNSIALRLLVPMGARGRLILPGVVPMLPYIGIWLVFSWRVLKVRMRSQLQLHIAFALCAIAALAKGLLGIGLPGLVLLLYLLLTWDWKKLRGDTIVMGVLNVVVIAFPWYHAMLIRHGLPFWNELMGDNHWRRLAIGRHGDNTGRFNYYIRELGYALMPWTAVAAAALPAALVRARPSTTRGKYLLFISIWMLVGYGLVTVSMTKFHHYILPAIPAIAILIGWFLDALLTGEIAALPAGAVMVLIGLPLLGLATWDLAATPQSAQRLLWLFDYDYINNAHGRAWPDLRYGGWICGFAIAGALATGLLAHARTRRWATLGLGLVAVGFTLFALDKFLMSLSPHWSQKHLLATFYQMRQPGDRLVAWQMYWRGETFYSENELYDPRLPREDKTVFLQDKNVENLQEWLRKHPGVRVFFVVERARLQTLQSLMVNPSAKESLHVVDETNNKFVLAVAQN